MNPAEIIQRLHDSEINGADRAFVVDIVGFDGSLIVG